MPNLDKTGPNGNGPVTGRGRGDCIEENTGCGLRRKCRRIVDNDNPRPNRIRRNINR